MRMPMRRCAIVRSWQHSRHLREVSEGWKTQRQSKEWEQINVFSLDERWGAGSTGSPSEDGSGLDALFFGGPYGCWSSTIGLLRKTRSRSIANRDSAGGHRGKSAEPAQGSYGRGLISARSSGHRAQGRFLDQEVVRG